jgi:hypothetical protein
VSARTNGMTAARARVRERRAAQDRERMAREQRIEDAAARLVVQAGRREDALRAVADIELEMGALLVSIIDEGEDVESVAELCEVDATDVRRWARRARAVPDDEVRHRTAAQ